MESKGEQLAGKWQERKLFTQQGDVKWDLHNMYSLLSTIVKCM